MSHDIAGGTTRRGLIKGALVATAGAGTALGAASLTSNRASAQVGGLTAEDVSVSGADGELASLTIAPEVTVEWDSFPDPVAELSIRIAASVPSASSSGEVAEHTATDVSGTGGSYSHGFGEQDLLGLFDAATFADETADDAPSETGVDLSAGVEFYDADGNRVGPAPVDLLSFQVSVTNTGAEGGSGTATVTATPTADPTASPTATAEPVDSQCRGEPQDCDGVSMSGSMNTGGSASEST